MKRLNKITLILVAVMGMAISGCGGDIKKAPFVQIIARSDYILISLSEPCYNTDFYKTNKAIEKCFAKQNTGLNVNSSSTAVLLIALF